MVVPTDELLLALSEQFIEERKQDIHMRAPAQPPLARCIREYQPTDLEPNAGFHHGTSREDLRQQVQCPTILFGSICFA